MKDVPASLASSFIESATEIMLNKLAFEESLLSLFSFIWSWAIIIHCLVNPQEQHLEK